MKKLLLEVTLQYCPMNPLLEKKGGSSAPRKIAIASIECFQEEFDLVDIWRVKNPEIKQIY